MSMDAMGLWENVTRESQSPQQSATHHPANQPALARSSWGRPEHPAWHNIRLQARISIRLTPDTNKHPEWLCELVQSLRNPRDLVQTNVEVAAPRCAAAVSGRGGGGSR